MSFFLSLRGIPKRPGSLSLSSSSGQIRSQPALWTLYPFLCTSSSSSTTTTTTTTTTHVKSYISLFIIKNNTSSSIHGIRRYNSNNTYSSNDNNASSYISSSSSSSSQDQTPQEGTHHHHRRHRRRSLLKPVRPAVQVTSKAISFFQQLFLQIQVDTITKIPSSSSLSLFEDNTNHHHPPPPPPPPLVGFRLMYQQSQSGQPRMVFTFDVVRKNQLGPFDEGISLQSKDINHDDKKKKKKYDNDLEKEEEEENDNIIKLPMLYIHHGALIKVLGCTIDIEIQDNGDFLPMLYDAQGQKLEP